VKAGREKRSTPRGGRNGNGQTMPIIEGVGDELVYTALVAAPIVFIFRSSLRYSRSLIADLPLYHLHRRIFQVTAIMVTDSPEDVATVCPSSGDDNCRITRLCIHLL
jgi:hypothetical protein